MTLLNREIEILQEETAACDDEAALAEREYAELQQDCVILLRSKQEADERILSLENDIVAWERRFNTRLALSERTQEALESELAGSEARVADLTGQLSTQRDQTSALAAENDRLARLNTEMAGKCAAAAEALARANEQLALSREHIESQDDALVKLTAEVESQQARAKRYKRASLAAGVSPNTSAHDGSADHGDWASALVTIDELRQERDSLAAQCQQQAEAFRLRESAMDERERELAGLAARASQMRHVAVSSASIVASLEEDLAVLRAALEAKEAESRQTRRMLTDLQSEHALVTQSCAVAVELVDSLRHEDDFQRKRIAQLECELLAIRAASGDRAGAQ